MLFLEKDVTKFDCPYFLETKNQLKLTNVNLNNEGHVYSLIEMKDKRIACGGDCFISIYSLNLQKKTFKREIFKENPHWRSVLSLCSLDGNRLLSGGEDYILKIWQIHHDTLTQIIKLIDHNGPVFKVMPLINKRFASCDKGEIIIWKDKNEYECISKISCSIKSKSILYLINKDLLVTSSKFYVSFWNMKKYDSQKTIEIFNCDYMEELLNGNICLYSKKNTITQFVIIDTLSFQIITIIHIQINIIQRFNFFQEKDFFDFDQEQHLDIPKGDSLILLFKGQTFQIRRDDYSTIYDSERKRCFGSDLIVSILGGKYLVIINEKCLSFIEVCKL